MTDQPEGRQEPGTYRDIITDTETGEEGPPGTQPGDRPGEGEGLPQPPAGSAGMDHVRHFGPPTTGDTPATAGVATGTGDPAGISPEAREDGDEDDSG